MDDNMFGTRLKTPVEEAWHNEQRRQEYDMIRISNPAQITFRGKVYDLPPKDFYIEYDTNQHQKVPFNSMLDVPRPRAERYIKHKKDEIVNFINQKMHDEVIAEKLAKGHPRYTDKYTENLETYNTQEFPKTDDEAVILELYEQLWIGITVVAGRDVPPPNPLDPRSGEVDLKSNDVRAMEKMNKKVVDIGINNPVMYQPAPMPSYTPHVKAQTPVSTGFSHISQKLDANDVTRE